MRTGGPRRMSENPPSTVTGMASRSTAAATPAGRSFLPTPPTDVLPLDTSPESVSAPGLAYSRVSSTAEIGTQCPARTSRERSEEHTSELRHLVISYAVFCLKKQKD